MYPFHYKRSIKHCLLLKSCFVFLFPKIGLYITNLGAGPMRCGCNKTNNANTDLPLYFIDIGAAPAVHSMWIFVCYLFANLNSQFVGP